MSHTVTESASVLAPSVPSSKALRAAMFDGMAWAAMIGFGETYLGTFGIFLGADSAQIAILATAPHFIGAVVQLVSVWSLRFFKSRRAVVVSATVLNALLWLPIALIPVIAGVGMHSSWLLIGLVVLYQVSAQFGAPAWNSLIGDIIPPETRGRFFGARNLWTGLCTFFALLIGGMLLEFAESLGMEAGGFTTIFLLACLARGVSAYWQTQYDDPPHEVRREDFFSLWAFLRRAPRSNFARFVFYASFVNMAVAFSGPFFAVYMLRELGISYVEFMVISAAMTITQFLTMQYWGALSDKYGNKKILNICGFGICFSPLLWVFSSNIYYLICVQIYSGFLWAGYSLAAVNFLFDAVTPAKRARCVAYQSVVSGAFVLAGALCGALVVDDLPKTITLLGVSWTPGSKYFVLFALSGAMRFLTACLFLPLFREVRSVEVIKHGEFLVRVAGLRPIAGATFTVITSGMRTIWSKQKRYSKN